MLKVTSRGIEKLGKREKDLSEEDKQEIADMFEKLSHEVVFPDKEDDWDGQTVVYIKDKK